MDCHPATGPAEPRGGGGRVSGHQAVERGQHGAAHMGEGVGGHRGESELKERLGERAERGSAEGLADRAPVNACAAEA